MSQPLDDTYYDPFGGPGSIPSPDDGGAAAAVVQANLDVHTGRTDNPHSVTKAQIGLGSVDDTADADKPVSTAQAAAIAALNKADIGLSHVTDEAQVKRTEMGAANGVATLDATGKVPSAQLPDAALGALTYKGSWNAATNTPTIPAAAGGNDGWYYIVKTPGTTVIDGDGAWAVGDWILSNGVTWEKIVNSDAVVSVNGKTGAVDVNKADVGLGNADNTSDAGKPVSTLQAAAIAAHANRTDNPHATTKGQVGLGNVDNTSDAGKPISSAQAAALALKIGAADLEETRLMRVAKVEYGTLPASSTPLVLCNLSGGGNAELLQLSLLGNGSTDVERNKCIYESTIRITVDGVILCNADLGTFHLTAGSLTGGNTWVTDEIAVTKNDPVKNQMTGFRRLLIPFASTLVIELVNASALANATVWSQVQYRTGAVPAVVTGTRKKKLRIAYSAPQTLAAFASLDILPTVAGRGQIEGVHLFFKGVAAKPTWLEGDPTFLIDGVSTSYGGTEDFFGTTFYGGGTAGMQTDSWGICQNQHFVDTDGVTRLATGMYRLFRKDPVIFNTSAKLTIKNGESGQASAPPAVTVSALVFYYLDQ